MKRTLLRGMVGIALAGEAFAGGPKVDDVAHIETRR
jgi:hypothetical protein